MNCVTVPPCASSSHHFLDRQSGIQNIKDSLAGSQRERDKAWQPHNTAGLRFYQYLTDGVGDVFDFYYADD